jgi:hypothetical protein
MDLFGDKPVSFLADADVDEKNEKHDSVRRKFSQMSNRTDPNDYLQPQDDDQKQADVAASSTKTPNSSESLMVKTIERSVKHRYAKSIYKVFSLSVFLAIIAELTIIIAQRFYIFNTYETMKIKTDILEGVYIIIDCIVQIHFNVGMIDQALRGKFDVADPTFTYSKIYYEKSKSFLDDLAIEISSARTTLEQNLGLTTQAFQQPFYEPVDLIYTSSYVPR